MKQRGIEIGVVADVDRDLEDRVLPRNQTRSHGVAPSRRSAFLQEIEQAVAQSSPGGGPEPEEGVQGRREARAQGRGGGALEQRGVAERMHVDDLIADCDAAPPMMLLVGALKHREREILDREVAVGSVGAGHPAAGGRVVRVVDRDHDDLNRNRS